MSELTIGSKFTVKKSNGWDWFGTFRWWEADIEVTGFNGSGGYWIVERWHWNGSPNILQTQPRTLTPKESRELETEVQHG